MWWRTRSSSCRRARIPTGWPPWRMSFRWAAPLSLGPEIAKPDNSCQHKSRCCCCLTFWMVFFFFNLAPDICQSLSAFGLRVSFLVGLCRIRRSFFRHVTAWWSRSTAAGFHLQPAGTARRCPGLKTIREHLRIYQSRQLPSKRRAITD